MLLAGHNGRVHGLAFIGSGTILFSASKDKTVMQWDLLRAAHRKTMEGEGRGGGIMHAPRMPCHVATSAQSCRPAEGPAPTSHTDRGGGWAEAAQSSLHACAWACVLKQAHVFLDPRRSGAMCHAGHTQTAWSVAMSKDSQTIYSCSHDETIRQWDIMAATVIKSAKAHTSTIYQLALSPDGKLLASVSADKTVKVGTRLDEPGRSEHVVCG